MATSLSTNAVFVMGTSVNVGKTVTSLGILSHLRGLYDSVGYVKPVGGYAGTDVVSTDEGVDADKDAVLVKQHFGLSDNIADMSPVLMPPGYFTKQAFVRKLSRSDKIQNDAELLESIRGAFGRVHANNDFTVVEGTGHAAMGSLVNLTNARVAAQLGADVVLVTRGNQRLSGAIDDLALNLQMCKAHKATVRGVVMNMVPDENLEHVRNYIPSALAMWGVPLLGIVPESHILSTATMEDLCTVFGTELISGGQFTHRRFDHCRLVTGSREEFVHRFTSQFDKPYRHLCITHSSREDIFDAMIELQEQLGADVELGLVTTGNYLPRRGMMRRIREANIPTIYAPMDSYQAMNMLAHHVPQTGKDDLDKIMHAIDTVANNLDFENLLNPVWQAGVGRF